MTAKKIVRLPIDSEFYNKVVAMLERNGLDIKKIRRPEFVFKSLTHKSFDQSDHFKFNYEYLEFLGDAVLEFYTSDRIFQNFPKYTEGEATRHRQMIVSNENLAKIAHKIGLVEIARFGKKVFEEIKNIPNSKVFSDMFESFIGALYFGLGIGPTFQYLDSVLLDSVLNVTDSKDPKSYFQEIIQANGNLSRLRYVTVAQNNGEFKSELLVDQKVFGVGYGHSKKQAEKAAAISALKKMETSNF